MSKKVIIVSTPEIHNYFQQTRSTMWDVQYPVTSIKQLWDDLRSGKLSTESEIVIFGEELFDVTPEEYTTAVATFCPEALVMSISYSVEAQDKIRDGVARKLTAGSNAQFVFITPEHIEDDINTALEMWEERKNLKSTTQEDETITVAQTEAPQPIHTEPVKPVEVPAAATIATNMPMVPEGSYGLKPLGQRGLIVASTSSKGGSGKTTVALCTASMIYHSSRLAYEKGLRDRPLSVVVVDMDIRDGQVGFLIGATTPTALKYYVENDFTVEALQRNLVSTSSSGLGISALLAPKVPKTADYLDVDFYGDTIAKLTTMFDVVVLDTSVNYLDKLLGSLVLPTADAIMFVTNLSRGSTSGMARWMKEVTSNRDDGTPGLPKEKIGIVINQSMENVGVDMEEITQSAMDARMLAAVPLDSKAVVTATNEYRLQDVVLKHPTISPAYFQIVSKLLPNEALVAPHKLLQEALEAQSAAAAPSDATIVPAGKKKKGLFK